GAAGGGGPGGGGGGGVRKEYGTPPKQTLGANAQLQKTTALLPEQLQAVVYLNMPTAGAFVHGARLPECPPPAFALRTLTAGAEAQFVIPFDTLKAVFETFNPEKERKK